MYTRVLTFRQVLGFHLSLVNLLQLYMFHYLVSSSGYFNKLEMGCGDQGAHPSEPNRYPT